MNLKFSMLLLAGALHHASSFAQEDDWSALLDDATDPVSKWSGVVEGNATAIDAASDNSLGSNWFARLEYKYTQHASQWVIHAQLDYDYLDQAWALPLFANRDVTDRLVDLEKDSDSSKQLWYGQIDWAYWQHDWQQGRLTLGRQPVTVGLGRIFSPVDPLGAFSVFDLDRLYKRGVDAIRYDYFASNDLLTQTVVTGNQNDKLNLLQVVKGTLEQGVWLLTAAIREEQRYLSASLQQYVSWLDADVYGEVLSAQLRGTERLLAHQNKQQRYLVGLSTKVGKNGTFTLEWQQQSLAASTTSDYDFWQQQQARSQIMPMGVAKRYLAVSYSDEWRDLTRYEILAMQNLIDNHPTLSLAVTHSASDNLQLRLALAWTPEQGARDSEFEQFANVLQLGFRYYF